MTCGLAVKRPHDYEAYLSPDAGVEVKRSRPTHCSPFRPQLGTLAATLPHTSSPTYQSASNDKSPFAQVRGSAQLSDNQLEDYLRTEIKYLKRRKLIPKRLGESSSALNNDSSSNYRRGGSSPSSSHSGSDSEGEQQCSRRTSEDLKKDLYEKPTFSLNQVKLICERLLKEQETRLRHEYETALNRKLDEKHEEYIQFAKEQLERHSPTNLSYLS